MQFILNRKENLCDGYNILFDVCYGLINPNFPIHEYYRLKVVFVLSGILVAMLPEVLCLLVVIILRSVQPDILTNKY